jgi:hypothetical protein
VEEQKENKSDKDHTEVDQKVNKKTRRRSLRLKKKDEVMEIIDLGSPEPVNKEETSSSDNKQEIGKCFRDYNLFVKTFETIVSSYMLCIALL